MATLIGNIQGPPGQTGPAGPPGAGALVPIGDTPPPNPQIGQLWVDTS